MSATPAIVDTILAECNEYAVTLLLFEAAEKLKSLPRDLHVFEPAPLPTNQVWSRVEVTCFHDLEAERAEEKRQKKAKRVAALKKRVFRADLVVAAGLRGKARRMAKEEAKRNRRVEEVVPFTELRFSAPMRASVPQTFEERAVALKMEVFGVSRCVAQEIVRVEHARKVAHRQRVKEMRAGPKPEYIILFGRKCPKAGRKTFMAYAQKKNESRTAWRKRVHSMVNSYYHAMKVRSEETWALHEPLENLTRFLRGRDLLSNSFGSLSDDQSSDVRRAKAWVDVKRPKSSGRKSGPKTNWAFNYIEARLALQKKRAAFHDEWREARFLRRDKMSRVVISYGNHRVVSLQSALVSEVMAHREELYQQYKADKFDIIEGQMDKPEPAQGTASEPKVEKKSNVTITKQVGESVGDSLPKTKKRSAFSKLSLAESEVKDKVLHDRFYTFYQTEWTNGQAEGSVICDFEIPKFILQSEQFKDSPGYAMFSRHIYWKGDVEIQVIANTNCRQFGQLQFSFYYGDMADSTYTGLRRNIWCASQRLHTLLTANVCNTVKIKIPFEYLFPVMQVNRQGHLGYRSLGRLTGLVIVPITAAATCPNDASLSFAISFPNNEFAGMLPSSICADWRQGQMMGALATVVAVKSLLDRNRDAPTLTSPGMPVIPINSSSWCIGNGQSTYNNILRLNPHSVLPYPDGRIPDVDEMTVDHVKEVFGMFKKVKWDGSMPKGTLLFSFNATPLDHLEEYPPIRYLDTPTYCVPPVGVLSSLYAYWRGSLELRIDLVASTEISGSLVIAYVPSVDKNYNLTVTQAFSCSHSLCHIAENRQINFSIPFMASHMFWPRRTTLSAEYPTYAAPGAVFCFVYNKLKVNCTIPDETHLICYLRGGKDFEVAVPACPTVAAGYYPVVFMPPSPTKRFVFVSGYTPVYVGTWHSAYCNITSADVDRFNLFAIELKKVIPNYIPKIKYEGQQGYVPILRYGAVSDHVSQISPVGFTIQTNRPYLVKPAVNFTTAPCSIVVGSSDDSTHISTDRVELFIVEKRFDGYVYIYPLPMITTGSAARYEAYFQANWRLKDNLLSAVELLYLMHADKLTKWKEGQAITIQTQTSDWWTPKEVYFVPVYPPISSTVGQGDDEKTKTLAPVAAPQKSADSGASQLVFGEKFLDLKDYCRRFQLYASDHLSIKRILDTASWRTIVIRFPVLPQGLDLDLGTPRNINEYWNRTREGPIPLIASGYRFFTGGIRYRICINVKALKTVSEMRGKIFVQHRPDVISTSRKVTVQSGASLGTDDLELPGYAAYHQFDDLNNVISVEIPFYMPCIRTYLQRPSNVELARKFSNLGEISIGVTVFNHDSIQFNYDIYYSLADDARFSVFIGFPPVIDISQIPNSEPPSNYSAANQSLVSRNYLLGDESIPPPATITEVKEKEEPTPVSVDPHDRMIGEEPTPEVVGGGVDNLVLEDFVDYEVLPIQKTMAQLREEFRDFCITHKLAMNLRADFVARFFENPEVTTAQVEEELYLFKQYYLPRGQMFSSFKNVVGLNKAEEVIDKAEAAIDKVDRVLDEETIGNIQESSGYIKRFAKAASEFLPTVEGITDTFKKYLDLIINAITNLCHVIMNFNLKSVVIAISSFFVQLKVVSWNVTSTIFDALKKLLGRLVSRQIESDVIEGQAETPEEEKNHLICGYVSSLVAGVAAVLKVSSDMAKSKFSELGSILLNGIGKFAFTANHLFTFIKNNLLCIKRIGEYFFSDHPSMKQIQFLQGETNCVYEWASEVIHYTDPRQENDVFTDPLKATKVYALASQGSVLHINMLNLNLTSAQERVLNKLIEKIEKLRDRLSRTHTAPPVRFEPFMYELTGPTGIGKSELLKSLPYDLFKFMNFTHQGELIYHRQLGNPYWNGLRNQPVCTVDEKFPIKSPEFAGVQLAELFQLKSSCVFNPLMADIPDKNIRYNPLIVQYASNTPFPSLDGVLDKEAVYRRRDCLIKVEMKQSIRVNRGADCKYKDLTPAEKSGPPFNWLHFRFYLDPSKADNSDNAMSPPMEYNDFKVRLCENFRAFFLNEETKYRRELQRLVSLSPRNNNPEENRNIADMFNSNWFEHIDREQQTSVEGLALYKLNQDYKRNISLFDRIEDKCLALDISIAEYLGDKKRVEELLERYRERGLHEIDPIPPIRQEIVGQMDTAARDGFCIHEHLIEAMACLSEGTFHYDSETNEYCFDWDECKNDLTNLYPMIDPTLKGKRSEEIWESMFRTNNNWRTKIYTSENSDIKAKYICFKFKECGPEVCFWKDAEMRRAFVSGCVLSKPSILARLKTGKGVHNFVPKEFIEGVYGPDTTREKVKEHEKLAEEVPKIRTWKQIIYENIADIKWQKWFKRIAYAISIFGLIGAIVGLFNFCKDPEDPISSALGVGIGASVTGAVTGARLATEESKQQLLSAQLQEIVKAQMASSGDHKTLRTNKNTFKVTDKVIGNASYGLVQPDNIRRKLYRNTFFIGMKGRAAQGGRCLGIHANKALIVSHYYECWQNWVKQTGETEMFYITAIDGKISLIPIDFKELEFKNFSNSSLGILTLPKRIKPYRDIRNLICQRNHHSLLNMKGVMAEMELHDLNGSINHYGVTFEGVSNIQVRGNDFWSDFNVKDGYTYEGFSGTGKCGSVLLAERAQAPIIGMHVAGYTRNDWGFSEIIYREMFDDIDVPSSGEIVGECDPCRTYLNAYVTGLGSVPAKFQHRERGRSQIVPSEIQRDKKFSKPFQVYAEPAILSGNDSRIKEAGLKPWSPMIEGCKHHGHPLKSFKNEHIQLATDDLLNLILAKCKPERQPALLTIDEAVGGLEIPGYEHINFATSEGFPWVAERPASASNKRWLFNFDKDNKYLSTKDKLLKVLEDKWNCRLQNTIPSTIFTDCLKDSVIPLDKILIPGKTRIFSISPVDFTIQQRQVTLDFSVAYMNCRRDLEHMIGCNPNSMEWTWLATDLLSMGNNILTGDYSKYGDSLPPEFIHAAFKIIRSWYVFNGCNDPQLIQQLKIMPYEIANCTHLMFDHLYTVACGQPSGNSLTVILNSLANSLYLRVAWLSIMEKTQYNSLTDFSRLVKMFSYGDDLIASLNDLIKDSFNGITLQHFFGEHGLKFTNANKSNEMIPYASLAEAEFLKAGFSLHPERNSPQLVLAPLQEASIENTVNWVWSDSFGRSEPGSPTFRDMTIQVCKDSVRNAYGRGPEYYNKWVSKLRTFWLTKGVDFKVDTWHQLDAKIFELGLDFNPWSLKSQILN